MFDLEVMEHPPRLERASAKRITRVSSHKRKGSNIGLSVEIQSTTTKSLVDENILFNISSHDILLSLHVDFVDYS